MFHLDMTISLCERFFTNEWEKVSSCPQPVVFCVTSRTRRSDTRFESVETKSGTSTDDGPRESHPLTLHVRFDLSHKTSGRRTVHGTGNVGTHT